MADGLQSAGPNPDAFEHGGSRSPFRGSSLRLLAGRNNAGTPRADWRGGLVRACPGLDAARCVRSAGLGLEALFGRCEKRYDSLHNEARRLLEQSPHRADQMDRGGAAETPRAAGPDLFRRP